MTPRAIEHITITTGAARMSARSEVSDDALLKIRQSFEAEGKIAGTEWRIIPLPTGDGAYIYDLSHAGTVIARCWLCLDRNISDAVWEAASQVTPDERVRLARPRGTPWLAAAILPAAISAALKNPAILVEAGDLERCVAWTLIESEPR